MSYSDMHRIRIDDLQSIMDSYSEFATDFLQKFGVTFNLKQVSSLGFTFRLCNTLSELFLYCIVLHCITFYCIVMYWIVLHCNICNAKYCFVVYCIVLHCILLLLCYRPIIVLYCIVLICIVSFIVVLNCIVVYYVVLSQSTVSEWHRFAFGLARALADPKNLTRLRTEREQSDWAVCDCPFFIGVSHNLSGVE